MKQKRRGHKRKSVQETGKKTTSHRNLPDIHPDIQVFREKSDDAPIYTLNPKMGLSPEFTPSFGRPMSPLVHAIILGSILKDTLSKDAFNRFTSQPADILVMGPDYECQTFMKSIPKVFKEINRLDFVDIEFITLDWLQRLARKAPELKRKVELYHANFADMGIIPHRFDVIIAENLFTPTLWIKPNYRLAIRGKPQVSDDEINKTLAQWGKQAAGLLKTEPPGILYTIYGNETFLGREGFSKCSQKQKGFSKRPPSVWCRDKTVLRRT